MSRLRRLAYLTGLLATTVLAGCAVEPAEYLAVQLRVGDVYNVRGVLEQARPSQPLTVNIRVGNFGQEVVTVEVPCPPFRVTNRSGDVVGPHSASCAGAPAATITLLPGETAVYPPWQWAGEGATGMTLPTAAYGLEAWIRRADRDYPVETGVGWVCLVPDSSPPPNPEYHDCGLPGDVLPSRNLPSGTLLPSADLRF